MVRVLQELSALDGGGVAKLLYDYYRNMDHTKIHFDFLIFSIMSLSYDLYYWKMRSAVGALRTVDKVLCLSSGSICVLIIMYIVIKSIKGHKKK